MHLHSSTIPRQKEKKFLLKWNRINFTVERHLSCQSWALFWVTDTPLSRTTRRRFPEEVRLFMYQQITSCLKPPIFQPYWTVSSAFFFTTADCGKKIAYLTTYIYIYIFYLLLLLLFFLTTYFFILYLAVWKNNVFLTFSQWSPQYFTPPVSCVQRLTPWKLGPPRCQQTRTLLWLIF